MKSPSHRVIITSDNVDAWPKIKKLLDDGKVRADSTGRLRYKHGAPVGAMVRINDGDSNSSPYRELADEWFDPDSSKAESFVWP